MLRVIERLSPLHGEICMSLLKQAYVYLKRPGVSNVVDAIVRPALDAGPAVVVGHSLGTVVTFKLLRQLALEGRPLRVPLYVTLGSPLPLMAVQAALGPAFLIPSGVDHWLNAVDPDDLIALGRGLDPTNFAAGIKNLVDIRNVPGNPHSIQGYIGDKRVSEAILASCNP
jgi:pimeloyl-ACP methyl ester carboxylesterase